MSLANLIAMSTCAMKVVLLLCRYVERNPVAASLVSAW